MPSIKILITEDELLYANQLEILVEGEQIVLSQKDSSSLFLNYSARIP